MNLAFLNKAFEDERNKEFFLTSSRLYQRLADDEELTIDNPAISPDISQLLAKLHCHWGVPMQDFQGYDNVHTYARAMVYDLRRYTDGTFWGPFKDDGKATTDWEALEAIMLVLDFNLAAFSERNGGDFKHNWDRPFVGATPNTFVSLPFNQPSKGPSIPLDLQDPYGVTGTWRRVSSCFLHC